VLTNEQESTLEIVRSLLNRDGLTEYVARLDASEASAEGALIERLKLMLSGDAAFCKTSIARSALKQAILALSRESEAAVGPIYQVRFSHGWMDVDAMDYDGLSGDKRIVYAIPQSDSAAKGA